MIHENPRIVPRREEGQSWEDLLRELEVPGESSPTLDTPLAMAYLRRCTNRRSKRGAWADYVMARKLLGRHDEARPDKLDMIKSRATALVRESGYFFA